jgi:hypothetical protein
MVAKVMEMDRTLAANMGGKVAIEQVTPAMATRWLEANTRNRPVQQRRVDQYTRDMQAGNWYLSNDAVAFSTTGQLLNGQHRLWAIIESERTVQLLVVRDLPEESRAVMDLGQKRTAGQNHVLLTKDPLGKRKMELANFIRVLIEGHHRGSTYAEQVDFMERFHEGIEWACTTPERPFAFRGAFVRGPLALAHKTNPGAVAEFAEKLVSGANLSEREPALVARNKILSSNRTAGGVARRQMGVSVCRAIVAHLNGEKLKMLYATEDAVAFLAKAHGLKLETATRDGASKLTHRATAKKKAGR